MQKIFEGTTMDDAARYDPQYDPAWLERMYNVRAGVAEHASYLDRWAQASRDARAALPGWLDMPYGHDAARETLDVFPAAEPGAPVLVFVHGGDWCSHDKNLHSFVAPGFVAAGVCVVVVNYALCPGTAEQPVTVATIARQVERAVAWVWRHIGSHGGDRDRIVLAGHGAGGHLASLLLVSPWPLLAADLPDGMVRRALSVSGLYDLEPVMHTPFLQRQLHLSEQQVLRLSPARLQPPHNALLHCVVGGDESEEYLRQCRLPQQAWGSHTVPRTDVLQGLNHFSMLDAFVQPGHDVHQMALNLLRAM
jgi:arylformamidase